MKNMNLYKAEILRRSEARIRKRKKMRRRFAAFCIPVCLCTVILLTGIIPKTKNKPAMPQTGDTDSPGVPISCLYDRLEINGSDSKTITDCDRIAQIYTAICSFFDDETIQEAPEVYYGEAEPQKSGSTNGSASQGAEPNAYTVIFADGEQTQRVFILYGNTLKDERCGSERILTVPELEQLRKILGLQDNS